MMVPIVHRLAPAERDPVALLEALREGEFAFLLESAAGDSRWGRYTYLGAAPREVWRYRDRRVERWLPVGGGREGGETADPIGHLRDIMRRHDPEPIAGLPPFWGGAVGF